MPARTVCIDTDARLEVPPHETSCHSVHCSGMSTLEILLEFLRQLGIAVKVSVLIWAEVHCFPEEPLSFYQSSAAR